MKIVIVSRFIDFDIKFYYAIEHMHLNQINSTLIYSPCISLFHFTDFTGWQ